MKATYPNKVRERHLKTLEALNWPAAGDNVHCFVSAFIDPYVRENGKVVKAPNSAGQMHGVKRVYDASTPELAKAFVNNLVAQKMALSYGVKVKLPNGAEKFGTLLAKEWEKDHWQKFFGFDASCLVMKQVKS